MFAVFFRCSDINLLRKPRVKQQLKSIFRMSFSFLQNYFQMFFSISVYNFTIVFTLCFFFVCIVWFVVFRCVLANKCSVAGALHFDIRFSVVIIMSLLPIVYSFMVAVVLCFSSLNLPHVQLQTCKILNKTRQIQDETMPVKSTLQFYLRIFGCQSK